MKKSALYLLFAVLAFHANGQIKMMSYNILNYPTSELIGRADTLQGIVDYVEPDLLMVQELKSAWGLEQLLTISFANQEGNFATSEFVPQQGNPGNSNSLQQAIIYDTDKLTLHSQAEVITTYRDVNEFVLFLNDQLLADGADTTFIYLYVTHLKSSSGNANEQLRLEMVEAWREYLDENVPEDAMVIMSGDFNLYSSTEPAYELLLGENETIPMNDPLDAPGVWTDSGYPNKQYLTQSTRSQVIFGDGASGGLDDRFDFILVSDNLMDQSNSVHYAEDTYLALGNNGTCYNQDILDCDQSNDVPYSILRSLYYMSDHLPIIMELETSIEIGLNVADWPKQAKSRIYYNDQSKHIVFKGIQNSSDEYQMVSTNGSLIAKGNLTKGQNYIPCNIENAGLYLFLIPSTGETLRFYVQD
jgi:endonuclease/exonuclease/phosphatase family metal-dependent hydrolase